jgi:hypothetical protein
MSFSDPNTPFKCFFNKSFTSAFKKAKFDTRLGKPVSQEFKSNDRKHKPM